jgi:transposase
LFLNVIRTPSKPEEPDSYVGIPITLFLDNARYQKCALVIATAARLQIELCFLPPYSPNLNLIERLWRFVKKKCLYSTYYPSFRTPFVTITLLQSN